MSSRLSGRLISMTSAHRSSPSAPTSTSLKTQATHPPSVRERTRTYPTAVAPPISRRSPFRPAATLSPSMIPQPETPPPHTPNLSTLPVNSLLPNEFYDVSVFWHFTGGHGSKPGIRIRLFYWL